MSEVTPSLSDALLTFLHEGLFYGVSLGLQAKDVLERLGPEHQREDAEEYITLRWTIPPVSLTFDTETELLWSQEIDIEQPEILTALFDGLTEFSPEEVGQYLRNHAIPFEVNVTPDTNETDIEFHLSHAIEFIFFDDPEENRPVELRLINQVNTLVPHLIITRQ